MLNNIVLSLNLIIIFSHCSGFVKQKKMSEELKQMYYPCPNDNMWNTECECLIPWLSGKGIDVGCSNRSIFKNDVRVDIDKNVHPDIEASADKIPVADEMFDYLYAIHVLEHMDDTHKALVEWARVIKKGGIIAVVHPDVEFTKVQRPFGLNPDENPFYEHKHEFTQKSFLDYYDSNPVANLRLIASGVACGNWSFYLIFRKV